ncbi:MAG: hypothetical protein K0B09_06770 [Bacteroidales bacterium]|nr:hypothetical protein [Bacteroidales bacterium]
MQGGIVLGSNADNYLKVINADGLCWLVKMERKHGKDNLAGAIFTPVQIYNFSMLKGLFFVKNYKQC